jgi:hypothetical protein
MANFHAESVKRIRKILFLLLLTPSSYVLTAQTSPSASSSLTDNTQWLGRGDSLPREHLRSENDQYFEGYIQALLDIHYHEFTLGAHVKEGVVQLENLPADINLVTAITSFISDIPGVKKVVYEPRDTREKDLTSVVSVDQPETVAPAKPQPQKQSQIKGTWVPQNSRLFQPLVADPRRVHYSLGLRGADRVISKRTVTISMGDEWGIFRWHGVSKYHGDAQIGIEAGLWSVFDINKRSGDWGTLINSDYHVGIIGAFAADKLSLRGRLYHQSCHLGDEKMVRDGEDKLKDRLNPSMEALELVAAYQYDPSFRFYGGPGLVVRSDKGFKLKPFYLLYGAEKRLAPRKNFHHKTFWQPYIACHINQSQTTNWKPDITGVIGIEWSRMEGIGRKVRLYLEAHHGFSLEGQFSKMRNDYWSINLSYGF